MNSKQRVVLMIGFLLVLVMSLFPPWRIITDIPEKRDYGYDRPSRVIVPRGRTEGFGGYHFLFGSTGSSSGPTVLSMPSEPYGLDRDTTAYMTVRLDYYRLAAQVAVVVLLTGLAYFILRP